jgi:hypothetical protein
VNNEIVAAMAPNFAIRHASNRALVSQVRMNTPPVLETNFERNFTEWPPSGPLP